MESDFLGTVSLSDRAISEQYHMELATRFLMFRKLPEATLSTVGDIGDFLNGHLESLHKLNKKEKKAEEQAFRETFRFVCGELKDDAFKRFDKPKNRFLGGFSISGFETVALGVGFNVQPNGSLPRILGFTKNVQSIWTNDNFTSYSGSGVRASVRIPKIVPLGRKLFSK